MGCGTQPFFEVIIQNLSLSIMVQSHISNLVLQRCNRIILVSDRGVDMKEFRACILQSGLLDIPSLFPICFCCSRRACKFCIKMLRKFHSCKVRSLISSTMSKNCIISLIFSIDEDMMGRFLCHCFKTFPALSNFSLVCW